MYIANIFRIYQPLMCVLFYWVEWNYLICQIECCLRVARFRYSFVIRRQFFRSAIFFLTPNDSYVIYMILDWVFTMRILDLKVYGDNFGLTADIHKLCLVTIFVFICRLEVGSKRITIDKRASFLPYNLKSPRDEFCWFVLSANAGLLLGIVLSLGICVFSGFFLIQSILLVDGL